MRPILIRIRDVADEGSVKTIYRSLAKHASLVYGTFNSDIYKPHGPFAEILAQLLPMLETRHRALVDKYRRSILTILPELEGTEPFEGKSPFRVNLTRYVFRNESRYVSDYFRPILYRPHLIENLNKLLVMSAVELLSEIQKPIVLWLDNLQFANNEELWAWKNLAINAARQGCVVVACLHGMPERLAPFFFSRSFQERWTIIDANPNLSRPGSQMMDPGTCSALLPLAMLPWPFRSETLHILYESENIERNTVTQVLVQKGVLFDLGWGSYMFTDASVRKSILAKASPEAKEAAVSRIIDHYLSRRSYFKALVFFDHFDLQAQDYKYFLNAMQEAWNGHDFDCALHYLGRLMLLKQKNPYQEYLHLLAALLHHMAGNYDEARHFFDLEIERVSDPEQKKVLYYFQAHNYVFGLSDFKKGIEVLESAIEAYEAHGERIKSNYARNTYAYALFRQKQLDKAIDLESLAIEQLQDTGIAGDFLKTILHLNLGRLYRDTGNTQRAIALLTEQLAKSELEIPLNVVLRFHFTIGNILFQREDFSGALSEYLQCLYLASDSRPDSKITEETSNWLFQAQTGYHGEYLGSKFNQIKMYIHFNLAMSLRRLNRFEEAAWFEREVIQDLESFASDSLPAAQVAFGPRPPKTHGPIFSSKSRSVVFEEEIPRWKSLVRAHFDPFNPQRFFQEFRRQGVIPWFFASQFVSGSLRVEGFLLYDPCRENTYATINQTFRYNRKPLLFAQPSAIKFLMNEVRTEPMIIQEASLRPEYRHLFQGIPPHDFRLQILSPSYNPEFCQILDFLEEREAFPLIGALPLHLPTRQMESALRGVFACFLGGPYPTAFMDGFLCEKKLASDSIENIMAFKAKLTSAAIRIDTPEKQPFGLSVNSRYVRIEKKYMSFIDLLTGEKTLSEIGERGGTEVDFGVADDCRMLREMLDHGAIILK